MNELTNKTLTLKEVFVLLGFVFSISGIYFQIQNRNESQDRDFINYTRFTDQRLKTIEENQIKQGQIMEAQIKALNEFMTTTKAIAQYQKENEFVPLKPKR